MSVQHFLFADKETHHSEPHARWRSVCELYELRRKGTKAAVKKTEDRLATTVPARRPTALCRRVSSQ